LAKRPALNLSIVVAISLINTLGYIVLTVLSEMSTVGKSQPHSKNLSNPAEEKHQRRNTITGIWAEELLV
jgi:hypothetical protein